jgi:hypothetical protein
MVVVRWSSAPVNTVQQQHTVAGVDERMNAFRQHRGGAVERAGDELGHRDTEITGIAY